MTDISSTLDAIDAATGCQQCAGPLGGSPSDDFCGEACLVAWHANRADSVVWPDFQPIVQDLVVEPPRRDFFTQTLLMMRYARLYSPPPSVQAFVRITGV